MGKSKKEQSKKRGGKKDDSSEQGGGSTSTHDDHHTKRTALSSTPASSSSAPQHVLSWSSWAPMVQKHGSSGGVHWVLVCIVLGVLLGFAIGAGWTDMTDTVSPWRRNLGKVIRSSTVFQLATLKGDKWEEFLVNFKSDLYKWIVRLERTTDRRVFERNPSDPYTFALLREAIVREKGGYVHPDLGVLTPAPCGAIRGLGMVSDNYHKCQTRCMPGTSSEKLDWKKRCPSDQMCDLPTTETTAESDNKPVFKQEEVLLRIPLSYQMTRSVAMETLATLIPADVQKNQKSNFHALDDAAMLVLLLAHERGVGRHSRWFPYIISLPHEPSCGYSKSLRPHMLDALEALRHEMNVDVEGWSSELVKASMYADRIASGLHTDYGAYLKSPEDVSSLDNLKWALCQVASRATAGNDDYGSLRMVPVLDMVNHDVNAGGFTELTGTERLDKGDFVEAHSEDDKGAFVIRSLRHGRRRALRKGQELLANYNVPLYTPLDWFISLGFVPSERWGPWEKVEPVLPRVRRDGPFAEEGLTSKERWEKDAMSVLKRIGEAEDKWQ